LDLQETAKKVSMDLVKSVVIKGDLSASEDLTLDGQLEGSVRLPNHTLTIGPAATIKASISAKAVVIMGAVTGNVTAGESRDSSHGLGHWRPRGAALVVAEGGHLEAKSRCR
jgi:hypothetical protein